MLNDVCKNGQQSGSVGEQDRGMGRERGLAEGMPRLTTLSTVLLVRECRGEKERATELQQLHVTCRTGRENRDNREELGNILAIFFNF